MNKSLQKCIVLFIFTTISSSAFAQLTISAEIRPRSEFRYGFKTLRSTADAPAFFIEQRSRLYTNYATDQLEVNLVLQDVRIWGSNNQIYKTDNSLTNLYEAWANYSFSQKWAIKIGRQAIDLDNARFLGDLDWAQQGRSHDALLFIYRQRDLNLELQFGGAFNQNIIEPTNLFGTEYYQDNYKTMQYVWLHRKYDQSKFSFLFHNDGRQVAADTSMAYRQTLGVIADKPIGGFKLEGEFYFQTGRNRFDNKVAAYLIALNATYKTNLTPLTLGFDLLSGTSVRDSKDKAFDPLYGTNHKFYGYMDYFYVGNAHRQASSSSGLLDIYFKTNFKIKQNANLLAHFHQFYSGAKLYDPVDLGDELSGNLGSELDLVFVYKFGTNSIFHLGYSTLMGTESMEVIKNRGNHNLMQHWAWAMVSFKPVIFTNKEI